MRLSLIEQLTRTPPPASAKPKRQITARCGEYHARMRGVPSEKQDENTQARFRAAFGGDSQQVRTIADLMRALNMSRSEVHSALRKYVTRGFVVRDGRIVESNETLWRWVK